MKHLLYCLDYHHGQATRVVAGGMPHLPGETMEDRQEFLARNLGYLVGSLCREPRGHRQMLGAIATPPVTPGAQAGLIFLHPDGYFGMCGDSLFSAVTGMVETGMLITSGPRSQFVIDTVQGPLEVEVRLDDQGEVAGVTMENVASYPVGETSLVVGDAEIRMDIAFGGLYYGFVNAGDVGLDLKGAGIDEIVEVGSQVFVEAARQVQFQDPVTGRDHSLDLITLYQPVESSVHRVANFYAEGTMGRTPSGTGLSARVALEQARGSLKEGETFFHESPLGLRFSGEANLRDGRVRPRITARSYLMGINIITVLPEDPFGEGFSL